MGFLRDNYVEPPILKYTANAQLLWTLGCQIVFMENIPSKGIIFSDFICIFAMSDEDSFDAYLRH